MLDRVLRQFASFAEAEEADLTEWLALTGDERLRIGEQMREEAFGRGRRGLQRVLAVAERQED